MSKTTFYKYFESIIEFGMIRVNRKIANTKLYSINMQSPLVRSIKKNIDYLSEKTAENSLERISVKTKRR